MNQHIQSARSIDPQSSPARSRRWIMAGVAAAMLSAMSVAGVSYADNAPDQAPSQQHHGMDRHGPKDPANAEKRIDRMVERLLPDGTPQQKAKVTAIARSAMNDLRPLREQQRAARAQGIKLLAQPTIDRAALEQVRVTQVRLAETAQEGVAQLRLAAPAQPFALVLLDLMLPDADGLDVCRQIRGQPA